MNKNEQAACSAIHELLLVGSGKKRQIGEKNSCCSQIAEESIRSSYHLFLFRYDAIRSAQECTSISLRLMALLLNVIHSNLGLRC
jgi:hypothetical protein